MTNSYIHFFIGLRMSSILFGVFKVDDMPYLGNKVLSSFAVFSDRTMRLRDTVKIGCLICQEKSLYKLIQNERKLQP